MPPTVSSGCGLCLPVWNFGWLTPKTAPALLARPGAVEFPRPQRQSTAALGCRQGPHEGAVTTLDPSPQSSACLLTSIGN